MQHIRNFIISLVIAAIAVAALVYWLQSDTTNSDTTAADSTSQTQPEQTPITPDTDTKENVDQNTDSTTTVDTTEELEASQDASATIEQLSAAGSVVTASGSATGFSAGKCVYEFKYDADLGEKPVVRETLGETTSSGLTCPAVEIPTVEFAALGQWTLELRVISGNQITSATKSLEIQ